MIFTRFECPRCQHVFVLDGAEDAFADCPKCQSMALAIGEATSAGGVAALPQLDSVEQPAPAPAAAPLTAEATDNAGVFSGLFGESDDGPVPDVTSDDMRVPATLEEMGGGAAEPEPEDDPFAEATRQVDQLPASLLLTRSEELKKPAADDGDDFDPFAGIELPSGEEDIHLAPTDVLRPAASAERTEVLQNPLGGVELDLEDEQEDAWENGPPPSVPTQKSVDDEDAWENGPPSAALPRPPPASPAVSGSFVRPAAFAITRDDEEPVTSQPGNAPAPFDSGFFPAPAGTDPGAAAPLSGEEFNVAVHEPDPTQQVGPGSRQGAWDPSFASGEMPQEPLLLSSLEGQMSGSVSFQDPDSVGLRDAFSQLEAAFDGAAAAPEPYDRALEMAQDALRAAQVQHSQLGMPTAADLRGPNVPSPPSMDDPPVMRRARQRGHLTLSEEAKALAGISIQPEAGSQNLALELTRGLAAEPPPRPAPVSVPDLAPGELTLQPPEDHDFDGQENTDPVARARPHLRSPQEPEEERTFRGFTALRVAAAVFVALLLGGAVGAFTAPAPEKKTVTARDRAEQKFARGNHYYQDQRFDDALGEYRGALATDPTMAPAHRAKAAALAKLNRHEEAARAYYKYLEVAPTAVDADEVRDVIARWEGKTGS